ncbi:MAG: reverse transcriptase/maturase family protein [Polyangiaceae bacterium]
MKPLPNFELARLLELAKVAARGKRRTAEVAAFMLDPLPRLAELQQELRDQSYRPGTPRPFMIQEPKRRLIAALPFRDRVVQHLLVSESMPALERWFAPQSYACRAGYGTHRALRRACDLQRRFPWLLRLDIAKFFPSIDHEILLQIILPKTPPNLHWLARRIVASAGPCEPVRNYFPGDDLFTPSTRAHGLPIGNLTSQVWANAMLTPVDHLLASSLGIGTFVRYCDDILIYARDRSSLERALEKVEASSTALRLRLHATKCRLHRTTEPVAFLGFVLSRVDEAVRIRLRSDNIRRCRARLTQSHAQLAAGKLDVSTLMARVRSWLAHAKHGHTRGVRQSMTRACNPRRAQVMKVEFLPAPAFSCTHK